MNDKSTIGTNIHYDNNIPELIVTPKMISINRNIKYTEDRDEDCDDDTTVNEENSSNLAESPNISNDTIDDAVKKEVKKKPFHYLCPKEQSELNLYIKNNLFRRLKIVNEKHTHAIVFQCFDHMQIFDNEKRSLKFRNVLDFLNTTINARRNYLKHQIVRVMQGKLIK